MLSPTPRSRCRPPAPGRGGVCRARQVAGQGQDGLLRHREAHVAQDHHTKMRGSPVPDGTRGRSLTQLDDAGTHSPRVGRVTTLRGHPPPGRHSGWSRTETTRDGERARRSRGPAVPAQVRAHDPAVADEHGGECSTIRSTRLKRKVEVRHHRVEDQDGDRADEPAHEQLSLPIIAFCKTLLIRSQDDEVESAGAGRAAACHRDGRPRAECVHDAARSTFSAMLMSGPGCS